jgi:glycosyltransferase involved in cell wall biosynthesis
MQKVLFISYAFPPRGGIGVQRLIKFIKYLPKDEFEIHVLTSSNGFSNIVDESLMKDIPSSVKIHKVGYVEPLNWCKCRPWQSFLQYFCYRNFLFPDRESLWLENALENGEKIIKKEKINLIFSSSAPITNHLIAMGLKKKFNLKWVADFRDEWTTNPHLNIKPKNIIKAKQIEKEIINQAEAVTTVSEPIADYFRSLTKNQEKVSVITNGFDPDDFKIINKTKNSNMVFRHLGTLYGSAKNTAIEEVVSELDLPDTRFELSLEKRLLHSKAVEKMQTADVLVLILGPEKRPGVYSGKLFEYLAARKPILALAPTGSAAAELIKELKVGVVVDPLDKVAIKKEIVNFYEKWQKNELNIPQVDLERFNREKLAQKLAEIFNKLTKNDAKRICLVANTVSPQNEKLVRYLLDQGHEIHFICLDEKEIVGAKNYHIKQKKLVNKFLPWYLLAGFVNKRQALVELQALISKIKPDVVHGHGVNFAGILAYYSGFKPVVITTRGSDIMKISEKPAFEQYLIKQTLKNVHIVTGSSLALRDQALKLGTPKNNWRDVFFGIDLEVFKPVDTTQLKKELNLSSEKVIFCPRTVAPIYNTDILIQALAQIEAVNWKLILLKYRADDVYLAKTQNMIQELNLTSNIIWLESADQVKMNQLNNVADVVVSLAQSDGAAVSFLEAMASQAKIVISAVGFVDEWKDGKFWVVPIGDIEQTTKAIDQALKISKTEFTPEGAKNRQLIADRAEIKTNFAKFEKIYNELKAKS